MKETRVRKEKHTVGQYYKKYEANELQVSNRHKLVTGLYGGLRHYVNTQDAYMGVAVLV